MPRDKSRYRERRSSSYSSESSYERKKSKSKHKRRSRSRDRSDISSHRRRRSTSRGSRSTHRRRSYSRSLSRDRDRYESKSRRRSISRSRSKRDRSRSISSSRSKSKLIKKKSKKSRSTSSRSSSEIEQNVAIHTKRTKLDDTETKVEKAIKAAEAAGLTMTKIPTYEYKEVEIKEDMPTIHDRNLLAELNSDSFVPKSFTSSKSKKQQSQNIVIDLTSQTVIVPEAEKKVQTDDSIINVDEIPSEEELKEMWIQKLYHYRKKMVRGEN